MSPTPPSRHTAIPVPAATAGGGRPTRVKCALAVAFFRIAAHTPTPAEARSLLSPAELREAAQFRQEADLRRFLACRVLARRWLGRLVGVPPGSIGIERSPAGKPFVSAPADATGWFFNVSHSGDWGALAVSGLAPVGIDLEEIHTRFDADATARDYFFPEENRWLRSLPNRERRPSFYRLWTLKEAALKAQGTGLMQIANLAAPAGFTAPLRIQGRTDGKPWRAVELSAPSGYAAAIAVQAEALPAIDIRPPDWTTRPAEPAPPTLA